MYKRYFFLMILLYCIVIISNPANSEVTGQTYTDETLERYKNPSDKVYVPSSPPLKKEKLKTYTDKKEMERWCKRATRIKNKIEKKQAEITEDENRLSGLMQARSIVLMSEEKKKEALIRKIEAKRRQLKSIEQEMTDLEDEAHRKDIPPGWLRCQYD